MLGHNEYHDQTRAGHRYSVFRGGVLVVTSTLYEKLSNSGDFNWTGGEVQLAIGKPSETIELKSDQIEVTGNVTITNTPNLQIRWDAAVPDLHDNPSWDLITANGTVTGTVNLTTMVQTNINFEVFYTNQEVGVRKKN